MLKFNCGYGFVAHYYCEILSGKIEYDGNDSKLHSLRLYLFLFLNLIIVGIIGFITLKETINQNAIIITYMNFMF